MNISISIPTNFFSRIVRLFRKIPTERLIAGLATILALSTTIYFYFHDAIIAYGDAESHLNIAKRVVDSLTPSLAQLGGIWLPLPHILMVPFVYFDVLWRTGLAGSIVSGVAYVITAIYVYKLALLIIKHKASAFFAALIFMVNPAVLYLQSTPMTELTLIVFFVLSGYYFIKYLEQPDDLVSFLRAALFAFFAALSRYDGWFLVLVEAAAIFALHFPIRLRFKAIHSFKDVSSAVHIIRTNKSGEARAAWEYLEGRLVLFCTLAFFGILLWFLWDGLILGDPLFFTHSQFSAKSQQSGWLAKGQLPAYHHLWLSFSYYFITTMNNVGVLLLPLALIGLSALLVRGTLRHRFLIATVLVVPFFFYVVTLFVGQSIIFIPHLTPRSFEWTLFNVRYGVMMVPVVALLCAYLLRHSKPATRALILSLCLLQAVFFGIGYSRNLTYLDGVAGLSTAKRPDAEVWLSREYDFGLVMLDDYSRLISIIRSGVPMHNIIYVGTKPYWEESLEAPEKYARWIIVQRNDEVWKNIYEPEGMQGRLYKYFSKVYTSPEILIFKRNNTPA